MKFQCLIAFTLILNYSVMSQTLDYYPTQNSEVSDSDYKYGITILKETYAQIKMNNGDFNYVNYWNLAIAYMTLDVKEPVLVKSFLEKSRALNSYNFSSIFIDSSNGKNIWTGYLSDDEFDAIYEESKLYINKSTDQKPSMSNENSDDTNGEINSGLLKIMAELNVNDQKYRKSKTLNLEKQRHLDQKNLKIIDSLCDKYGGYLGKSIVGDKYAHVMWSVIQHSELESMERYLSEIHQAVIKKELNEGALKMLIDRVYSLKHNYQIFGSQNGVEIAPDKIVKEVTKKYSIPTAEEYSTEATKSSNGSSQWYRPRKINKTKANKFPGT